MIVFYLLCILFTGVAVLDAVLGARTMRTGTQKGRYLSWVCWGAFTVTVSYMLSVLVTNYQVYSILSSIYFAGIDVTLMLLLEFVYHFTADKHGQVEHTPFWKFLRLYMCFDVGVLLINPFWEIAVHYVPRADTPVAHYSYAAMPLFNMHLMFAYVLVVVILYQLIRRAMRVPKAFRGRFLRAIGAIIAVVAVNAVYLYWPGPEGYDYLDYSLLGYGLAAGMLYAIAFETSSGRTVHALQSWIVENIDQGIVLFDYNDAHVLHNVMAERMLTTVKFAPEMDLVDFIAQCGMAVNKKKTAEHYSFKHYVPDGALMRPLRCDYSVLFNENHENMGRLFVFSDMSAESDLLTGFHMLKSYTRNVGQIAGGMGGAISVVLLDLNGLTAINSAKGREAGDQAIQTLAAAMRNKFPAGTMFVRGKEAMLVAVLSEQSDAAIRRIIERIAADLEKESLGFQYAIARGHSVYEAGEAIARAGRVLRTKKLMDKNSSHSELLGSLVQALQECDRDTEAHVQRTQRLGKELGERIGLSDEEQSSLALLAILHDIGKIGVPLDILNKPGRLTDAEWAVMKTHTVKGYQIANRSQELKDIAEMILYHHERWDGKGYPDGLSKESIPLLSRVISVVDAYDAMVSDRAYRKALTKAKAVEELRKCAGTQFDPTIISAFLQMLREQGQLDEAEAPAQADAAQHQPEPGKDWSVNDRSGQLERLRVHDMHYTRYLLDDSMQITTVDDNFEYLTGYTREEVQRLHLTQRDLIFEEDRDEYFERVAQLIPASSMAYLEHRVKCKDGKARYVFCFGRAYFDSATRSQRTELIVSDSTRSYAVQTMVGLENERALRRLEHWEEKYRRDPLTGLLNHEAFQNDVEQQLLAEDTSAMMLMMDIDHFKQFNDTNGHRAGDEYLIVVAQALVGALRDSDMACRMGGDEFAAVLVFKSDVPQETMIRRAQQICDKINMTISSDGRAHSTISMGGAFLSESNANFDRLYEAADQALYRAKNSGRARFSL